MRFSEICIRFCNFHLQVRALYNSICYLDVSEFIECVCIIFLSPPVYQMYGVSPGFEYSYLWCDYDLHAHYLTVRRGQDYFIIIINFCAPDKFIDIYIHLAGTLRFGKIIKCPGDLLLTETPRDLEEEKCCSFNIKIFLSDCSKAIYI